MGYELTQEGKVKVNKDRVVEILRDRRRYKKGAPTNFDSLAEKLGIWEGGKPSVSRALNAPMPRNRVQAMAEVLGVRVEYILGEDGYKTEREKTRSELVDPGKDPRNDPSETRMGKILALFGYELCGVYLERWPYKKSVRDCLLELSEALNRGEKVPKTRSELLATTWDDDEDGRALPAWLPDYLESPRIYEYKAPRRQGGHSGRPIEREHVFMQEQNMMALENQIEFTVRNFAEGWEGAGSRCEGDPDFDFGPQSPKRIK